MKILAIIWRCREFIDQIRLPASAVLVPRGQKVQLPSFYFSIYPTFDVVRFPCYSLLFTKIYLSLIIVFPYVMPLCIFYKVLIENDRLQVMIAEMNKLIFFVFFFHYCNPCEKTTLFECMVIMLHLHFLF